MSTVKYDIACMVFVAVVCVLLLTITDIPILWILPGVLIGTVLRWLLG